MTTTPATPDPLETALAKLSEQQGAERQAAEAVVRDAQKALWPLMQDVRERRALLAPVIAEILPQATALASRVENFRDPRLGTAERRTGMFVGDLLCVQSKPAELEQAWAALTPYQIDLQVGKLRWEIELYLSWGVAGVREQWHQVRTFTIQAVDQAAAMRVGFVPRVEPKPVPEVKALTVEKDHEGNLVLGQQAKAETGGGLE